MENLALEVFDLSGSGSQFANLPDDASITITETSELFDSGDIWSYSFVLNVFTNPHIFGTTGDMHGGRLHEQIDKRRARLWVLGLPLYLGYLRLDDEVEVKENGDVDVSFESGRKTFLQMIEGTRANQVPIPEDILIGMVLDPVRDAEQEAKLTLRDMWNYNIQAEGFLRSENGLAQEYPKYVRPDGVFTNPDLIITDPAGSYLTIQTGSTINTDYPFDDGHPYCNTRLCYQDQEFRVVNGDIEKHALQQYHVSEPRRLNPAPNFFLLYWLKILMQHLGIVIMENQMQDVEDLRRLFFVNSKCAYRTRDDDPVFTGSYLPTYRQAFNFVAPPNDDDKSYELELENYGFVSYLADVQFNDAHPGVLSSEKWHKAYASSDNFPDADIKDVIDAIESGFGVRLMFNENYTQVRIVLLRNVFRSKEVHEMPGMTISESKVENCIRGFRLTYGGGEDDTSYNYKGFALARQKAEGGWITETDGHDYSQFNTALDYAGITQKVGMLNKTCYIDKATGNAYIIKIDENFKDADDNANASLFECAQWMDAEDGDCSGEENTVKEVKVGFTPMQSNFINANKSYALFVGEEMEVSSEKIGITLDTSAYDIGELLDEGEMRATDGTSYTKKERKYQSGLFEIATKTFVSGEFRNIYTPNYGYNISGWIREGYRLYLQDNYKPGEDLTSPLEKHEWGFMLGIMRGTGNGTTGPSVHYSADMIENEGNDTWEIKPGSVATAHSDTCDDYGNPWDYRSKVSGNGNAYGDYVISSAGGFPGNIRGKKGPAPNGLDVSAVIDTYYASNESRLSVFTAQGYYACNFTLTCKDGNTYALWLCCVYDGSLQTYTFMENYFHRLCWGAIGTEVESMKAADLEEILSRDEYGLIIFATPEDVPASVLQEACNAYLAGEGGSYDIPSSVQPADADGRISLKLRAEKPNPDFDPSLPESGENPRYLEISNPALRHRGLQDQFHAEESYWWRNARITKRRRIMEMADIMGIDKTVRQKLDDVTGFVRKLQYTVHMQTGLSPVDMEIWYL